MMGHKICFYGEISLIIPKSSMYPFLSGALFYPYLPQYSLTIFEKKKDSDQAVNMCRKICVFHLHTLLGALLLHTNLGLHIFYSMSVPIFKIIMALHL